MRMGGWVAAVLGIALAIPLAGAGVWWWGFRRPPAAARSPPARVDAGTPVPHVGVTLFDPSPDDDTLTPRPQEIPQGLNPADHGRMVAEAAVERAASPEVRLLPAGTALRTFFLTAQGEAILDLTGLSTAGLAAGTTGERLAVHALVSAVAANVLSVRSVRLLSDGHALPSMGGHIDVRNPLAADRQTLRAP